MGCSVIDTLCDTTGCPLPRTIGSDGEMARHCAYCLYDLDGYRARKEAREDLEDRRDDEYARRMGRL